MRLPEAQGDGVVGVVADDGRVVGAHHDGLLRRLWSERETYPAFPEGLLDAVVPDLLDVAVEPDLVLHVEALDLPGVALVEPVIRLLDLVAVADGLLEDAVGVPEAVAPAGVVERGDGVQEARGEAARNEEWERYPRPPLPSAGSTSSSKSCSSLYPISCSASL